MLNKNFKYKTSFIVSYSFLLHLISPTSFQSALRSWKEVKLIDTLMCLV
jgi:hypothetical protein